MTIFVEEFGKSRHKYYKKERIVCESYRKCVPGFIHSDEAFTVINALTPNSVVTQDDDEFDENSEIIEYIGDSIGQIQWDGFINGNISEDIQFIFDDYIIDTIMSKIIREYEVDTNMPSWVEMKEVYNTKVPRSYINHKIIQKFDDLSITLQLMINVPVSMKVMRDILRESYFTITDTLETNIFANVWSAVPTDKFPRVVKRGLEIAESCNVVHRLDDDETLELYYKYAEELIKKGYMYVCDCVCEFVPMD
jgi:hypothetical protein